VLLHNGVPLLLLLHVSERSHGNPILPTLRNFDFPIGVKGDVEWH